MAGTDSETMGNPPAKKAKLVNGNDESSFAAEHDVCLVLDYGSQYTQLITRRVRELGVASKLLPGDAPLVGSFSPYSACSRKSFRLAANSGIPPAYVMAKARRASCHPSHRPLAG